MAQYLHYPTVVHGYIPSLFNAGTIAMLCLLALAIRMLVRPNDDRPAKLLLAILGSIPFVFGCAFFMDQVERLSLLKYDYLLYSIDGSMGLSAFNLVRLIPPQCYPPLFLIYQSLWPVIMFWYAVNLFCRTGRPAAFLKAILVTFAVGPFLYLVVPGRGPRYAFGAAFPFGHPQVSLNLVALPGWPNAMPSLHMTAALLFVWFAPHERWLRVFAWLYLAATAAATLTFEHYCIDLVVALPFAFFAMKAGINERQLAVRNLLLVLGWLFLIRWCTPTLIGHVWSLRAFVLLTILMSIPENFWRRARALQVESAPAGMPVSDLATTS